MTPVNNGWRALDSTGKAHTCPVKPKKEKKNRVKKYMKYCNKCLQQIRMVNENGKWKPRDLDGAGHRCEKFSKVFDDIIKGD